MTEHEYIVWSTYKVTGTAYVHAKSAAGAVEKALDICADDPVQFDFSDPWGETKMQARRVRRTPPTVATEGDGGEGR